MMPFFKRKEAFMKKTILLCALAGMFTAMFFSCGDKGTDSNNNQTKNTLNSISGTVTDSVTGRPISNAMVYLRSSAGLILDSIATDVMGSYAILGITGSSLSLRATANKFITKNTAVAAADTSALTINVKLVMSIDETEVGKWFGAIGAIHVKNTIDFNGEKIFADFSGADSTFALITRDTTRAGTPLISDTTLVLTGVWKLNAPQDSVLLVCDTCRIIDTTLNTLVPRSVRGEIIPVFIDIANNPDDGYVEWQIRLTDFLPIAPLMGLNLSPADAGLLSGTIIALAKMSQE